MWILPSLVHPPVPQVSGNMIDVAENCGSLKGSGKISEVRDGVPVWYSYLVKCTEVSACSPISRNFLGNYM